MQTPQQTNTAPLSGFGRTLVILVIADVALLLFLTWGWIFPSRMNLPEPEAQQPASYYDYTAKISPLPKAAPKRKRHSGRQYSALLVNGVAQRPIEAR